MPWVSREEWGARKVNNGNIENLIDSEHRGVVVHYSASDADEQDDHDNCARRVKKIQTYHIDVRGYDDIAYHRLVCRHGYTFQGRPASKRSAAQGCAGGDSIIIPNGNRRYHAICFLGNDDKGQNDFPILSEREVSHFVSTIRKEWKGRQVLGHREVCHTGCPGGEISNWIDKVYG